MEIKVSSGKSQTDPDQTSASVDPQKFNLFNSNVRKNLTRLIISKELSTFERRRGKN
jgi:hypothetical protein